MITQGFGYGGLPVQGFGPLYGIFILEEIPVFTPIEEVRLNIIETLTNKLTEQIAAGSFATKEDLWYTVDKYQFLLNDLNVSLDWIEQQLCAIQQAKKIN